MFGLFGRKRKNIGKEHGLPRNYTWVKPDESWLLHSPHHARPEEVLNGPVAEFYPDRQLFRLAMYYDGKISSAHHCLELELGRPSACVKCDGVVCKIKDGIEELELNFEGSRDFSREVAEWENWVRKWIAQITMGKSVLLYYHDEFPAGTV